MTIERVMRMICNGDHSDPGCEPCGPSYSQHAITAATMRRMMASVGWQRHGLKDYCRSCAAKLEANKGVRS